MLETLKLVLFFKDNFLYSCFNAAGLLEKNVYKKEGLAGFLDIKYLLQNNILMDYM